MLIIEYPSYQPKIKIENNSEFIFDEFRKKWVRLTPEEWVRQNFLQYLVKVRSYPATMIAVEKEISVGELKKRFDIVVYNKDHKPWLLVECKEMNVSLNESVLQQALGYNVQLQVKYFIVTNGTYCAAFCNDDGQLLMIDSLPDFE